MSGILYVVATPIGNLEDVTLRALRVLREVSVIAAEDTRRTAKLLQHYSISTPTTSLHEHNEHAKASRLLERIQGGESIALVSDAGTPVISDPGARLVRAAHDAGITVQPIPGPSAITAIISAAGIGPDGFSFVGFPPSRSNARKSWLLNLTAHALPLVAYEAPHRIEALLRDIASEMGDRTVAIGRELTKRHETLAVRPIKRWLETPPPALGEFVLIIYPANDKPTGGAVTPDPEAIAREFDRLTHKEGLGRREALKSAALKFSVSTRDVFAAVERQRSLAE
ncbi:MAG: 16S rRNA (cytidine(1402)-2'-O)-methyltransferase [Acidobacteriota bacterium]|nr:16S rRNA (cytidine(1402)-2'-O)-methyltransferase [Acidobacteriota bacterium]MDQ3417704.1 16S rRNA (cytidine(1402)-2'-O)-methyltransferase [Acidobacteriota bacterium]